MPGNQIIRIISDKTIKNIFFTYSYWANLEEDLENYRNLSFLMKFGPLPKNSMRKKLGV
jgi:hypothetical protein